MEVPTAKSVGNHLVYMRLIYPFELKTLAVLYLPDHEACTSTVYRPPRLQLLLWYGTKETGWLCNVCTSQRMICDAETHVWKRV